MKNMISKSIGAILFTVTLITSIILAARSASADVILGAPGVPVGAQVGTAVPFKNEYSLSNGYKFVFSGIEAKGNTVAVPGMLGTGGLGVAVVFKATVSADKSVSGTTQSQAVQLTFGDINAYNTSPLVSFFASPVVVFQAKDVNAPLTVKLVWESIGLAVKPNGTFNILGEFQACPPHTDRLSEYSDGE